ncbi:MAG TPA: biotin/lipoate A/B protein ligase family protein [Candidatus Nanoarchaeia archaeon]|nr:biotin/lipoate A/B protein ligase family protein [Candidatus Nanoarchaeia archaeon]
MNSVWRLIPLETHNAFMNMAIDEAITESVAAGGQPTIRFYQWDPSAVSIGYFQSLSQEVNEEACKGMHIVRRRTGGGAVYHDAEITYSVIAPESMFQGITESYHEICGWIIKSLGKLGIQAEFKPINDVIVQGKKISGNAQTRRNKVLLQHGTILYDVDVDKMFSLLRVPDEKIRDKVIASVKERVTSVRAVCQREKEELYHALLLGFTDGKQWEVGRLSEEEKKKARELARRYESKEWNYLR